MGTELALIEVKNPLEVFSKKGGLDAIIDKIEQEAKSIDRDISTPKGRDNVRSIAFNIAKAKNRLDEIGKDLTTEQRAMIDAVNEERARAWKRMETLQLEIRKPLTDWEEADKKRTDAHEAAIAEMVAQLAPAQTSAEWDERIIRLGQLVLREWEEFKDRAAREANRIAAELDKNFKAALKAEEDAAELKRLQEAEQARLQKERDDKIAADAAAKAKREAEELAEKNRLEAERVAKAEADKAAAALKAEQERAAKAEADRLAAIAKAEADKVEAARKLKEAQDKAAADAKAAAAKAEADKAAALKAQEDKIAAEKKAEEEATKKREADTAHRKKINGEALAAMVKAGISDDAAKIIITAIAKGSIPHVSIEY